MIGRPHKLLDLMTAQERRLLVVLLVVSLAAAVLESLGLGIIFVFLKVITDTAHLGGIAFLQEMRTGMSGVSDRTFLLLCLAAMLVFFFFRHATIFANVWLNSALRQKVQFRLARELFDGYLREPYASFVKFPSSTIVTTVTSNVAAAVAHGIVGLVELASAALMLIGIVVLILQIKPLESLLGLVVTAVFAGIYWFIMRERIIRWGRDRVRTTEEVYRTVGEVVRGIKTIKVLGVETKSSSIFSDLVKQQTDIYFKYTVAQQFPNAFFQFTIVAMVICMVAVMVLTNQNLADAVPTLALFGAAAFRALPAVLVVIGHLQLLQHAVPDIDRVYEASKRHRASPSAPVRMLTEEQVPVHSIELKNVGYTYDEANHPAIKDVSLRIERGEFVAFTGLSGSGKTTAVDLVLGLLQPTSGEVLINGGRERGAHQFGYVPQEPLIFDDTLRRNITLEKHNTRIDQAAFDEAIRSAGLENVVRGLPNGIHSSLGEWGMRLSGGERQRIGLARALYFRPEVLILDEPTSSLDVAMESQIIECLRALRGTNTIIMVAHRLTTIQDADKIFFFDGGRVSTPATFQQLRSSNPSFRAMLEYVKLRYDENVH
jgi:ABC-type multidrug transport system fused ATPase/permease subunit